MDMSNGKSRSSEFRSNGKNGEFKSTSGRLGTVSRVSGELGYNKVAIVGEDSEGGGTALSKQRGGSQVDGKVIDQLAAKIEDEISYHKSQVHELESKLKELRELSGDLNKPNNSD